MGEDAIVFDLTDSPPPRNGGKTKRKIESNYVTLEDISSDEESTPHISEEEDDQIYLSTKDEQEVIDLGSSSSESGDSDGDYDSDPIENDSFVDDEAVPLDIDETFATRNDYIPPVTFPAVSEHFWSVESLKRNGACAIDFSAFTLSRGKQDVSYKDRKDTREKKKAAKDISNSLKTKKKSDGKKKAYSSSRWHWKKRK